MDVIQTYLTDAQGDVATWAPSNSDMDADDWYLVQ